MNFLHQIELDVVPDDGMIVSLYHLGSCCDGRLPRKSKLSFEGDMIRHFETCGGLLSWIQRRGRRRVVEKGAEEFTADLFLGWDGPTFLSDG